VNPLFDLERARSDRGVPELLPLALDEGFWNDEGWKDANVVTLIESSQDLTEAIQAGLLRSVSPLIADLPRRWWFVGKLSYSTINARAEGVQTNASYREPFKNGRRCIVPGCGKVPH
jgi:putative SOS response-associated peptidase YedK